MVPFYWDLAKPVTGQPQPFWRISQTGWMGGCLGVLVLSVVVSSAGAALTDSPMLDAWLSRQASTRTWSADVVQTRTLKTLSQPLTAHGRLWFKAPDQFRWELGDPPQTIALRQPERMYVIYPELKRAELYPLQRERAGRWGSALALLEAGFPRNRADLDSKFTVISQIENGELLQIALQPKAASARRLIPRIEITLSKQDFTLRATQLEFPDGSTLRNDFIHPKLNPEINGAIFQPELSAEYKLVEPLK